jgi:hypothetical protein
MNVNNLKTYGELNLAKIRDEVGLDFAHYTYTGGRCSCCYFPHDLPIRYWKGKNNKERKENRANGEKTLDYEYILFKNASNGSGQVTAKDFICKRNEKSFFYNPSIPYCSVYIEWKMTDDKLDKVCKMLQEQLGNSYVVIKPTDTHTCIEIKYINS